MFDQDQIQSVIGQDVYGSDGEKIGTVGQAYLDDESGRPEWVTVRTGLFGTKETFVPVTGADTTGQGLTVPFTKEQVKDAPNVDAEQGHLSPQEEERLYSHYGRGSDYSEWRDRSGYATNGGSADRGTVGHDTSGPTTDDAMTRSEERLNVGTESREAGRARLRKYVVTEQEQVTVPVTREEVRIEREPITDANVGDAMDGDTLAVVTYQLARDERLGEAALPALALVLVGLLPVALLSRTLRSRY